MAVRNSYRSSQRQLIMEENRISHSDSDDAYATCAETYATLRIYTGEMLPARVSAVLRLEPSELLLKDEGRARLNGWFLSSKGRVESLDVRHHVDWLLDQIVPVQTELRELQSQPGAWMDVFCYWRSTQGHGGPSLNPKQMRLLADLNLQIGFDCY